MILINYLASFFLITAVAGSTVILFTKKAGKEEKKDEE